MGLNPNDFDARHPFVLSKYAECEEDENEHQEALSTKRTYSSLAEAFGVIPDTSSLSGGHPVHDAFGVKPYDKMKALGDNPPDEPFFTDADFRLVDRDLKFAPFDRHDCFSDFRDARGLHYYAGMVCFVLNRIYANGSCVHEGVAIPSERRALQITEYPTFVPTGQLGGMSVEVSARALEYPMFSQEYFKKVNVNTVLLWIKATGEESLHLSNGIWSCESEGLVVWHKGQKALVVPFKEYR